MTPTLAQNTAKFALNPAFAKAVKFAKPGLLPFAGNIIKWPFKLPVPKQPFHCCGPKACCTPKPQDEGLSTNGSDTIDTGRYLITVKENEVKIYDKETGTWTKAHGDPHFTTGDGDKAQFHDNNLTLDLADGTKVTIKVTDKQANGTAYIEAVAVMKGDEGVVVEGVHDGKAGVKMGNVLNNAASVDKMWDDGTVLVAGNQVDDWTFAANGKELVGTDPTQKFNEHMLDGKGGQSKYGVEGKNGTNGTGGTNGAGAASGVKTTGSGSGISIFDLLMKFLENMDGKLRDKLESYDPDNMTEEEFKKAGLEIQQLQSTISTLTGVISSVMKAMTDTNQGVIQNI
jgi:hypothetical protein